jgi:ligand-binding sensor domain-containing protein
MPQPPRQPSPCPKARPPGARGARLALLLLLPLAAGAPAPAGASPPSPLAAALGARTAEHWSAAQGVPGRVTALVQSADGYLWVGTRRGLVRFDGLRFSPIPASDGATEFNVRALLADPDGTLYVASDRGLGRLRQGRFTRLEAGERPVHALARGPDGALWAATETGLSRLRGDVLEPVADGSGPLEALTVDATGRLLAGGESGLWVHAGGRLVQPPAAEGGTGARVLALLTDRRGRTWVGTEAGLRRADPAGVAAGPTFGAGLSSPLVVALCEDTEGHLWVATSAGGLQTLSDDGATAAPPEEGWPSRLSTALLADRSGSVWSGSGSGLDRLRPRLLAPVPRTAGLPAEVVWSVYLDPEDDSLWIGLDGAGADHLVDGRLGPSDPPVAPAGSTVSATLRTRDGALWSSLGAGGVLRRQGGRSEAVRSAAGHPYVRVRGLYQGADQSVWLGTEEGLERVNEGRVTRVPVSHGWPFRVITEDAAGDLWAGGLGLVRLRAPDYREDTPPELAGQLDLVAILPDGPDLWLASYTRGLLLWHDQRLTDFAEHDPRLRGRAVAVLADDQDGLWVAMGLAGAARRASCWPPPRAGGRRCACWPSTSGTGCPPTTSPRPARPPPPAPATGGSGSPRWPGWRWWTRP